MQSNRSAWYIVIADKGNDGGLIALRNWIWRDIWQKWRAAMRSKAVVTCNVTYKM